MQNAGVLSVLALRLLFHWPEVLGFLDEGWLYRRCSAPLVNPL